MTDNNLDKIEEFIRDKSVLGFCSFLSAPLNRKLEEITEEGLQNAVKTISRIDKNLIYFIDPLLSEGRHMYAKSPFRKEKIRKRLSSALPNTLNLMAFAFADGNEGDHSSQSEDEA